MAINMELLKGPMDRVVNLIRNYDAILWAGSGLSLYAGYPSGMKLCQLILDSAESEEDKNFLQQFKNSLMDISNEFSQIYSRDKLIEIIKNQFDTEPKCKLKTHIQISKIPQINTIITTNYDHLFEIVYGENMTVCTGTNFKKSVKGKVDLYKIHGDTSEPSSVIITSKDYSQFYEKLNTVLWNKIKSTLAEKPVIFIGYSVEDKNIQDIFEKLLRQVDFSNKEFFIVTPTLQEHKLRNLNNICKTTHIPLTGDEFIEYIEKEIRQNIVIDAVAKKISIDEAYKICRENGITPTITNKPNGASTRAIVDKIELTPETFFKQIFSTTTRGFTLTSNPGNVKEISNFINDCDCKEIIVPAEDAIIFRDISGINIPENQMIDGKLPDVVKLEKQEIVEKLTLVLGEHNIKVIIRGFWGNVKSRCTVELSCINMIVQKNRNIINLDFSFRYPHTVNDAISDLTKLQLWTNGNDMVFRNMEDKIVFELKSISINNKIKELLLFINENISLYKKISNIEKHLNNSFVLKEELKTDDIRHISLISASTSLQTIEYTNTHTINKGILTLDQLELYKDKIKVTIEYPNVLPEDCFELFGIYICLGKRKETILNPFITNIAEAEKMIINHESVNFKIASKTNEAIREFI